MALPAVRICIPTKVGQIKQSFSPAPSLPLPIGGAAPSWQQDRNASLPVTPEGVVRNALLNSGKEPFPEPYPANGRRSKSSVLTSQHKK